MFLLPKQLLTSKFLDTTSSTLSPLSHHPFFFVFLFHKSRLKMFIPLLCVLQGISGTELPPYFLFTKILRNAAIHPPNIVSALANASESEPLRIKNHLSTFSKFPGISTAHNQNYLKGGLKNQKLRKIKVSDIQDGFLGGMPSINVFYPLCFGPAINKSICKWVAD